MLYFVTFGLVVVVETVLDYAIYRLWHKWGTRVEKRLLNLENEHHPWIVDAPEDD